MLDLLQGIRVVSFNHFLLGPMGIQALADLGADVIAVETPEGGWQRHWSSGGIWCDGQSMLQLCANRNKRSIALDLKSLKGKEIALKLVDTADVVAENFRPGVMEKLGLGHETLKARKPDLIYASASGYGPDGPYAERPGQDLLAQALFGMMAITGQAANGPRPAGVSVIDHHGAALFATGRARGPRAPRAHRTGLPRRREPDAVRARPAGRVARGVAQRPRPAEKGERAQARGRLVLRRALWRVSDRGRPHRPVADPARRPRRRRRRASAGDVHGGRFLHPAGPDRRPRRGRPQGAHDQPNGRRSSTRGSSGTRRCRTTPRSRRTRR